MNRLSEKIQKVDIICIEEGNWMVSGTKQEGGAINLGNFNTSAEASNLRDFLNNGIKQGLTLKSMNYLVEALGSLSSK